MYNKDIYLLQIAKQLDPPSIILL